MKVQPKIIILTALLSIVLILLGSIILNRLSNIKTQITVYTALNELSVGTTIKSSDLSTESVDLTSVNSNYATSKETIIGKVVKEKIYKGEPINAQRLAEKNDPNLFISNSDGRFSIPSSYIDDPLALTFKAGDVVKIIFTNTKGNGSSNANVVMDKAVLVGMVDESNDIVTKYSDKMITALIFQSTTQNTLNIKSKQYIGKFSFQKYPDNASD